MVAPIPLRRREPPRRHESPRARPSPVLAMLIFVITELMFFAGFISAFTIMRGSAVIWPPPGQPRLPVAETAFNTALLLASGVVLFAASRRFRTRPARLRRVLLVASRARRRVRRAAGPRVGAAARAGPDHELERARQLLLPDRRRARAARAWSRSACCLLWLRMGRGTVPRSTLAAAEIFWYFVVGVWPVLYWRVYLS